MKTDARALDHNTLTELRKRAVAGVQEGEDPAAVAGVLGVHLRTLLRWLALYRNGGWQNLDASKRGGRPRKLDGKAMQWIYNTVTLKNPLQLKFPFALWTSSMIGELVCRRFGVKLSRSSVCRLLEQLGLSAQRRLWRAYPQDPEAVRKWMKTEYPAIRSRGRKIRAEIYFGDEAGVRSDFHSAATWGKLGRTPIVSSTGARFGVNMISAVSAQGHLRFMLTQGPVTAKGFIEFLERLLVNASRPIFLLVDGHPSHKAKCVRRFVDSKDGRLELFLLPSCSPELNPDESVWNELKNNCIGRKPLRSREQMRKPVIGHLSSTPQRPKMPPQDGIYYEKVNN